MIYLNVAGLSPFQQDVKQEVTTTLEQFSRLLYSDEGIHYYRKTLQRCREDLAQWLQVEDAQHIAFVPNATTASWLVLSRIHWETGAHILTTTHENSTVLKEISRLHTQGVQVHTLDPKSPTELETEIEQLLISTQVQAILMSHVSHIDGRIFPVERIAKLAQAHQAFLIVDGAQAVGHIPINFQNWQPDAYFFPGHKWCTGPMGTGALILGEPFANHTRIGRDKGKESSQPLWADWELGTQNIGLIAGLAKACIKKMQEGIPKPIYEGLRDEWKTCLQEHQGLRICEWDGAHSPCIISFSCLDELTEQRLEMASTTDPLSWKSFAHPSYPHLTSVRLSWLVNSSSPEHSSALTFFKSM